MFPVELAKRAINEYYWPKDDALRAIEFLDQRKLPVVGIENVRKEGDEWRILDYSVYDGDIEKEYKARRIGRQEFLNLNMDAARRYIESKLSASDEFFVLTWLEAAEY